MYIIKAKLKPRLNLNEDVASSSGIIYKYNLILKTAQAKSETGS